ncbi:MAG: restriction endonuclease subunit S [Thermoplasmata archaeon]|nr:restriction endonuclease subunit S [Thermoplasmata archaeon]
MTELGPLPEEWEVVRLGDVIEKTKQKDPKKAPDWSFKYIDVSSVSRDTLRIQDYKTYEGKHAPSRARKLVQSGDVIFATVRPTLRRVALVNYEFDGHICSTAFCVLRARKDVTIPEHIFNSVARDNFISELGKIQRGASYPAVTDKDVKNQKIPLPPLPEQKRIAAVLSTIQRSKEKTAEVITAAKELKRSMMKHLFTYGPVPLEGAENVPLKEAEIGPVPEEWGVVRLGEVVNLIMGQSPPGSTYNNIGEGMPFLQGKAEFGAISPKNIKYTTDPKKIAPKGSVLMSVRAPVGDVNISDIDYCIGRGLASISLKKGDNRFLFNLLTYLKPEIAKEGTGSTFKAINKSKLQNLKIPLPPLPTQHRIAEILSTIDQKIEAEENKKKALKELFKTLLHDLMTAKIRVNDLAIAPERKLNLQQLNTPQRSD